MLLTESIRSLIKYDYIYEGIGHTQLSEFSACIDILPISFNTYQLLLSSVGGVVNASAWKEMKKAEDEEREIALKNGLLDEDGIPMCTVIADDQWSKRSYKIKHGALSGAILKYFSIII